MEDDFLEQLSAIDPCDPSSGHCSVYSLVQLDHNQLAIVNLGRWEDLQKNVQSAVNKVQAGVKHASNSVRNQAQTIVNKAKRPMVLLFQDPEDPKEEGERIKQLKEVYQILLLRAAGESGEDAPAVGESAAPGYHRAASLGSRSPCGVGPPWRRREGRIPKKTNGGIRCPDEAQGAL